MKYILVGLITTVVYSVIFPMQMLFFQASMGIFKNIFFIFLFSIWIFPMVDKSNGSKHLVTSALISICVVILVPMSYLLLFIWGSGNLDLTIFRLPVVYTLPVVVPSMALAFVLRKMGYLRRKPANKDEKDLLP